MTNVKTRFVVAITQKLSAAPDSDAKLELIEELSENLYSRYQDLVRDGAPETEAYERALGELGDVNELLEYLKSLGPDGAPDGWEPEDFMSSLFRDIGGLAQEAVVQAQRAMDDAADMVQDAAEQFQQYRAERNAGWVPADGENVIPSGQICAIEVGTASGDVSVSFDADPNAPVRLTGDMEGLETRLDETGLLSIRQKWTSGGGFPFLRMFRSAGVDLILPRRHWESIHITTASGDVDIEAGLVTGRLHVETASGDLDLCHADCEELVFRSASGDFDGENIAGAVKAETMSGDISLSGMLMLSTVHCASVSGDVEVSTGVLPERLELSSKSGDCEAELPDGEGFRFRFNTVSGDISCDFPLSGPMGRRSGEGIYLDGGTAVLSMSTVSGDLTLRQQ